MAKTVQKYQSEFGLAVARELQRNQERSRRGRTPLQPSLGQAEARAAADATNKANNAQNNAQYNAANDAQWRADNAYNGSVNYTNSQMASVRSVPPGALIMWTVGHAAPAGFVDTGHHVRATSGVEWTVLQRVS